MSTSTYTHFCGEIRKISIAFGMKKAPYLKLCYFLVLSTIVTSLFYEVTEHNETLETA